MMTVLPNTSYEKLFPKTPLCLSNNVHEASSRLKGLSPQRPTQNFVKMISEEQQEILISLDRDDDFA